MKTIVFVLIAGVISVNAGDCGAAEFSNGRAIATVATKNDVRLSIEVRRDNWTQQVYVRPQMWGAEGEAVAKTVVSGISATLGDDSLYIPFSSYSDLADPWRTELIRKTDAVELVIHGGSGGLAYIAVLTFKDGKHLVRRKVASVEMSRDVYEVTNYYGLRE
jgi:hypothetical protein